MPDWPYATIALWTTLTTMAVVQILTIVALRNWQGRYNRLRDETIRTLGIHQNLLADYSSRFRGQGLPVPPVPSMDDMFTAWRDTP